jgi:hypothetical protein
MNDASNKTFPALEAAGWHVRTKITDEDPHGFIVAECHFRTDGGDLAQLFATAPTLLTELHAAHLIIRNALNLMTPGQKVDWNLRNGRDGVDGEGTTRANEREAIIAKATGRS